MMNDDRLAFLWDAGRLRSEGMGPLMEWAPVPVAPFQRRHDTFWRIVAALLESYEGDYDDLPDFLTETGSELLEDNN